MRARSLVMGAWLLAGCASSKAYQTPPAPPPGPHPVVAHDPRPAELPAHHFYARPTSGDVYPRFQAVAFTSLPAMVRSSKCTDAGSVPEGRPGAGLASGGPTKARAKAKKSAPGHVPYAPTTTAQANSPADDASRVESKAAPPGAGAAAPTEPAGEAEATMSGADLADEDGGMTGDAPGTFSSEVQVAGNTRGDNRSKRDTRRSRREAKRAHDKALATASAEAPATAAEPDAYMIEEEPPPVLEWPPPEEGWGSATFLSNDDTMSLSSAQRVIFAIDEHLPLPPQHVRPHELLNYFSFQTDPVPEGHAFSVRAELAPSQRDPGFHTLGLAIAGRPVGREGRRNAALTLVIDRSGSMKEEGRMDFLKRGLLRMVRELKDGDVIHVVTFDHRVCNPLRNFVVGRDDMSVLTDTIHGIKPSGRTNLHAGLQLGYQLADASYQATHTNRVMVITDALANTGVTDARTMAMVADWFDARRIRLSGIGVGRTFDDALLDRLTEKGRGAYVFLGSAAEVDAVFGSRFSSLVETVANDVHFRLHLPPSLRMQAFHGEEASTVKADVQAVHFFADTSQLLLADLETWQGQLRPQDDLMLEIEYQHPETGQTMVEDHVITLGATTEHHDNVRKGEVIMHFVEGVGRQARRGAPAGWQPRPGTWLDAGALEDCSQTRDDLRQMAAGSRDPEVARVLSLWDGYCARFEGSAAGRPGRKPAEESGWPGAKRPSNGA
ncbi:vWA domain-containing protein [Paraliomyxa miuraensis]|uniref:vWA domain-containing protein n=1 Tax=Paraliomyxa miuraensis TaxID=376150 RepID=UPI002257D8BE|nr:VWA domain-containing protein [Paraliomyxa miuraensis]MCX4247168.1 VWA domain-containing protein [Paraliomyxa miuraensis]